MSQLQIDASSTQLGLSSQWALQQEPRRKMTIEVLLSAYLVVSFLHSIEDARYARTYPLSGWNSVSSVYVMWISISALGLLGYLIYRSTMRWVGQTLLCFYAAVGLDGLFHYTHAPISAHSPEMNISIVVEAVMAATLLAYLLITARRPSTPSRRS